MRNFLSTSNIFQPNKKLNKCEKKILICSQKTILTDLSANKIQNLTLLAHCPIHALEFFHIIIDSFTNKDTSQINSRKSRAISNWSMLLPVLGLKWNIFNISILSLAKLAFKCQFHKMVKHTQTIDWQIANELFECVWPFCGIGT